MSKEAGVNVLEVCKTKGKQLSTNPQTWIEAAVDALKRLIEHRIMHGSKDTVIGIVLIGTPTTQNKLHDKNGSGYFNITTYRELETIQIELLKQIEQIKAEKTSKSDWIDGLLVACDMITETCGKWKYTKWIFLITDGESKLTGADDLPLIV